MPNLAGYRKLKKAFFLNTPIFSIHKIGTSARFALPCRLDSIARWVS
jgi:hypothetical protein